MFTAEQLIAAQSKVKSGEDFPAYIQDIKKLGVTHYECYVKDGHTDYHGSTKYTASVPAKYDELMITEKPDMEKFRTGLKDHQMGKTDFLTFIRMCAVCGIEKWVIRTDKMTCTYYDQAGKEILVEEIPDKTVRSSIE